MYIYIYMRVSSTVNTWWFYSTFPALDMEGLHRSRVRSIQLGLKVRSMLSWPRSPLGWVSTRPPALPEIAIDLLGTQKKGSWVCCILLQSGTNTSLETYSVYIYIYAARQPKHPSVFDRAAGRRALRNPCGLTSFTASLLPRVWSRWQRWKGCTLFVALPTQWCDAAQCHDTWYDLSGTCIGWRYDAWMMGEWDMKLEEGMTVFSLHVLQTGFHIFEFI